VETITAWRERERERERVSERERGDRSNAEQTLSSNLLVSS